MRDRVSWAGVSAIAGSVSALVGALAYFAPHSGSVVAKTEQNPIAVPSSPTAASEAALPRHPSVHAHSPKSDQVRWQGAVRITSEGLGLDSVPPSPAGISSDVSQGDPSMSNDDPESLYTWNSDVLDIAVWKNSTSPSKKECSDLVATEGVSVAFSPPGTSLCVKTIDGHIATIKIKSVTTLGDAAAHTAYVIVWQ